MELKTRYYLDAETGLPHIHRHGVSEAEVEEVLRRPGENRPGRDDSRVAVGQTQAGRYLRVMCWNPTAQRVRDYRVRNDR